MSSEAQDAPTEPSSGAKTSSPEANTKASEETTSGSDKSIECPNCGRAFAGTYCPDCGQEVGKSLTMAEIAGNAFRDAFGISGGFWKTLVGLTTRPERFYKATCRESESHLRVLAAI